MGAVRRSFPRFRREGDAPRIELTGDDIDILQHVYRHRFIRTDDLYRLFPERSAEKISRRLMRLYRNEFLDRPLSQIDRFRGGGSQPLVYGLDTAGARYLAEECDAPVRTGDWKARNRAYTRENLDHTLAVTKFMVDLELACAAREDVELIRAEEIVAGAPEATRALAQPARWGVTLPWHGHEAIVQIAPDALFGLRRRKPDGSVVRTFVFVEIDRGSMTIAPSDAVRRSEAFLYRSSLLRKFLAYAVSHQNEVHQRHFGLPAVRILFLTSAQERATVMQQAAASIVLPHLNVSPDLFLFSGDSEAPHPLNATYKNAADAAVSLIPAPDNAGMT
jgi:hypothetical protein